MMAAEAKAKYQRNWWARLRADPVRNSEYKKRQQEHNKLDWKTTKADPELHARRLKLKRESATARRAKDPAVSLRQKKSTTKWRRSPNGFLKDAYRTQREVSRRKGYIQPNYSFKELKDWTAASEKFSDLFSAWKDSGYDKELKPSFDRINPLLPYSLDNLQVLTWRENYMKGIREKHLLYTYAVRHGNEKFKAGFGEYLKSVSE